MYFIMYFIQRNFINTDIWTTYRTKLLNFTNFHENNCSFQFELTRKLKQLDIIPEPTARSAVRRGLLIPLGYLHPGKCEHSEVQSHPPLCNGRNTAEKRLRMRQPYL